MSISSADDVFLMTFGLASLDHLALGLGRHDFIQMYLDSTIPTASDDRMVIATITNEGDLAVKGVVLLKLKCHDS